MTHILTLIANAGADALDENTACTLRNRLPDPEAVNWLSPLEACDIPFSPIQGASCHDITQDMRKALGNMPIDIVCQRAEARRKRLLIADMDSTLIGQECIDELADFANLKPKISAITERAMRGELEFEPAFRARLALLKGLHESVLEKTYCERITLNPGARTLARTMAAHGATTVIVSGGFTYFTGRVAEAAGFSAHHANILQIADGKLSGMAMDPILGSEAKRRALYSYREKLNLEAAETLAVGDGANDLAMIQEAGLGVAYHAKPIVAEKAHARIDHGDLTALLFAQGYTRSEFTEE